MPDLERETPAGPGWASGRSRIRTWDLFLISVLRGGRRVRFVARFHGLEPNEGRGLLGVRAVRWGPCASGVPLRVGRLCSPRGGLASLTGPSAEAGGGVKRSASAPAAGRRA